MAKFKLGPRKVFLDGVELRTVRKVTTILHATEVPTVQIELLIDSVEVDADGNIIITTLTYG